MLKGPLCSEEGCENVIKAHDLCEKHYGRWYYENYRGRGVHRTRRVKVPIGGPHLVGLLFHEMNHQGVSSAEMARRSGIDRATLVRWQRGVSDVSLNNLEACWKVLGYTLNVDGLVPGEEKKERPIYRRRIELAEKLKDAGYQIRLDSPKSGEHTFGCITGFTDEDIPKLAKFVGIS